MSTTIEELLRRVEKLEAEAALLKAEIQGKDWRKTIGMFSGNEVMRSIDEAALRIREEDRRMTRMADDAPKGSSEPGPYDWERSLEMFTGDEGMRRIMEEAMRLREADREAARNDSNYHWGV